MTDSPRPPSWRPARASLRSLRSSPLAHRSADLAAVAGGVRIAELPFLTMLNLRVDPGGDAGRRVAEVIGGPLPSSGAVAGIGAPYVVWLGPDEWLVIGPDGEGPDGEGPALLTLLQDAVGTGSGSVLDVGANRTTLELAGPSARDLLEKGCTLDLHPRAFAAGRCAQTTFARAHALIWQTRDDTYRLLVRASFAGYVADWLIDAAGEFAST